jgi:ABC-2 type transport system permease protein
MNGTIARLTVSSLLGRRRALLLLVLPVVLLLLAVAIRVFTGHTADDSSVGLLGGFAIGTLVPLVALIAGTGAIGPEIDDGSIIYLLAKPLSRHSVLRSKLVVAAGVSVLLGAVSVLLAGLLVSGTSHRLAVGYAAGAAIASLTYCALFLLLSVLTRNAVVIGLLYVLIWESLVGGLVPGAQALSVQQWALAITARVVGSPAADLGIKPAVGTTTGAVLLVVVTVAATWFAGHRLRSLRITGED